LTFDNDDAKLRFVLHDPSKLIARKTVFSNYAVNTLLGGADTDTFFARRRWDVTDWDRQTELFWDLSVDLVLSR
jgi:hypothetical protein